MRRFFLGAVLTLLWMGEAHAQVDLRVTPNTPRPSQPWSLHANGGGCDRFRDLNPSARVVTVQGSVIEVTVPYAYASPCVLPLVPVTWTLPGVPAGIYTVELYGEDDDFPRALIEAIGVVVQPGAVAAATSVIPSTSRWALVALMLGIAWVTGSRSRE